MFDSHLGGPDAATTFSLVSAAHHQVLENECRLVELAAHWADLHHPDSQAPAEKTLPGAEQARQLGGEGTPEVLEFAPAELATHLETSHGSARSLMADALDLRHRLPELWQLILAGGVPSWKARKVAQATRHLSRSSAMQVDAAVGPAITALPWGRFENLLAGKIIEADPRAAEEQAKIWEAERFVRAGRTKQSGLKLLIAKAQRPAAEPQHLDDSIDNDPEASFDTGTVPPDEDSVDTAAEQAEPAQDHGAESVPEPGAPEARSPVPDSDGRGLIIQPSGVDLGKLRPKVVLHIHLREKRWPATSAIRHDSAAASHASKASDRSPWARSAASSPIPDAMSRSSRSSTHRTFHRWTAMRSRGESAKPCSCACRPAASPTPPRPAV